jgi:hypothetical protein
MDQPVPPDAPLLQSAAPAPPVSDPTEGQSTRGLFMRVFPSICLPMFMAAVDATIVATALPAIAGTLGDVERISWVVVSYLMATTIAAPVYGRLGDALGRKRCCSWRWPSSSRPPSAAPRRPRCCGSWPRGCCRVSAAAG